MRVAAPEQPQDPVMRLAGPRGLGARERIARRARMGVEIEERRVLDREAAQGERQDRVLEDVGEIAGVCGVSPGLAQNLLAAPSVGRFFHSHVRGRYEC